MSYRAILYQWVFPVQSPHQKSFGCPSKHSPLLLLLLKIYISKIQYLRFNISRSPKSAARCNTEREIFFWREISDPCCRNTGKTSGLLYQTATCQGQIPYGSGPFIRSLYLLRLPLLPMLLSRLKSICASSVEHRRAHSWKTVRFWLSAMPRSPPRSIKRRAKAIFFLIIAQRWGGQPVGSETLISSGCSSISSTREREVFPSIIRCKEV